MMGNMANRDSFPWGGPFNTEAKAQIALKNVAEYFGLNKLEARHYATILFVLGVGLAVALGSQK